jgi:hypothetical protein
VIYEPGAAVALGLRAIGPDRCLHSNSLRTAIAVPTPVDHRI